MEKISLAGKSREFISALPVFDKPFRAKQVWSWINKSVSSFDEMTDLSASLRLELNKSYALYSMSTETIVDAPDGTQKYQLKLHDGHFVEAVVLHHEDHKTACLSTQVGCGMGCAFCKTGTLGLTRNLASHEIVEQFLILRRKWPELTHIVFMGMGEPLANLPELRTAIEILRDEDGLHLSQRRITISTSGLVPGILDIAEKGPEVRLAVSLISARDQVRGQLMPVNKAYPLQQLREALLTYQARLGKRITFEVVVIGGLNDDKSEALAIRDFTRGMSCMINLIPWNPIPELPLEEPSQKSVQHLYNELSSMGINVTMRQKKGRGVCGACGQLGSKKSPSA